MSLQETTLQPAMIASGEAEAGGVLTIDLAAIAANWKRLYGMTVPVECAAVVKADAYGCGIERVVPALKKVGCRTFFVADIAEGRRVRAVAPDAVIYVLNGLMPSTAPALRRRQPAAGDQQHDRARRVGHLRRRQQLARRRGAAYRYRHEPARPDARGSGRHRAARASREGHGFKLLMSHFACAETPDHPMNDRQIRLFREIRILFRGVPSSLANSAGIFLGGTAHCDLVRPGIALFGGNPIPGQKNPMRPVVELKGRITQVRADQEGRHRRLRRELDRGAPHAGSRSSRSAMATAISAPPPPAKAKPPANVIIARQALPAGRAHLDGSARDRRDRSAGRRSRAAASSRP